MNQRPQSGSRDQVTSDRDWVVADAKLPAGFYIAEAVVHLRAIGEDVPDKLLAHTSPIGWCYIAFSGDFLWDRAADWSTFAQPRAD